MPEGVKVALVILIKFELENTNPYFFILFYSTCTICWKMAYLSQIVFASFANESYTRTFCLHSDANDTDF